MPSTFSRFRSDVFLIRHESISVLELPLLKHSDLQTYFQLFLEALPMATKVRLHHQANGKMKKVLEWLWDVAVGPVFEELGFTAMPPEGSAWPRVWWIGSGLLNLLPLHAAGYDDTSDSTKNALDRVISSYATTIKSLAYARENAPETSALQVQNAVLVSMPETPEQTSLPFAKAEVEILQTLLPSQCPSITVRVVPNPTRDNVLSAVKNAQILHLSCHGFGATDPSQSMLLLNDWKTSPLIVSDLTSAKIQLPQFAYLSACHTSSSRDLNLLDESIHLSSGVQLAGYPSVIGSLWQVNDKYSAELVRDVYTRILGGRYHFDIRQSAEALHHAVRALRMKTRTTAVPGLARTVPSDPLSWAPYIHLGI